MYQTIRNIIFYFTKSFIQIFLINMNIILNKSELYKVFLIFIFILEKFYKNIMRIFFRRFYGKIF